MHLDHILLRTLFDFSEEKVMAHFLRPYTKCVQNFYSKKYYDGIIA